MVNLDTLLAFGNVSNALPVLERNVASSLYSIVAAVAASDSDNGPNARIATIFRDVLTVFLSLRTYSGSCCQTSTPGRHAMQRVRRNWLSDNRHRVV